MLCQRSLRKRMKANHNGRSFRPWKVLVVSKIVEKKNESKSQLAGGADIATFSCVKDRWEKEWKQITTNKSKVPTSWGCVKDRWEKEWKQITTVLAFENKIDKVVSKIVEKKNESKSQPLVGRTAKKESCVKDRWEKEWKQITTAQLLPLWPLMLCQRSLRKRMKANHNQRHQAVQVLQGCVKDRWEKEWKQITTIVADAYHPEQLCQRSLRKRMKANHNCKQTKKTWTSVVSKIVEKKNESKSQLQSVPSVLPPGCVKDRWEKEWKQITTNL